MKLKYNTDQNKLILSKHKFSFISDKYRACVFADKHKAETIKLHECTMIANYTGIIKAN